MRTSRKYVSNGRRKKVLFFGEGKVAYFGHLPRYAKLLMQASGNINQIRDPLSLQVRLGRQRRRRQRRRWRRLRRQRRRRTGSRCGLTRKASAGGPMIMPACSEWSTDEMLLPSSSQTYAGSAAASSATAAIDVCTANHPVNAEDSAINIYLSLIVEYL